MDLREQTREVEQARVALEENKTYKEKTDPLSKDQGDLSVRVQEVVKKIRELKDGEENFGKEIALLTRVDEVMREAKGLLARPETGPVSIAAETEAIELLLQARRSNPNGGGGGASGPGGGGGGSTEIPALALMGRGAGDNDKVAERDVAQSTGKTRDTVPAEFREGLDEYFKRLEEGK